MHTVEARRLPPVHVAGSGSVGRVRARLVLVLAVVMGVFAGPATAYAGAIDILPGGGRFLANSVADLVSNSPAWAATVSDLAPAAEALGGGAVVAATLPADAVAAGILGTGALIYASWKFGSYVGAALPCFDCPAPAAPGPSSGGVLLPCAYDPACVSGGFYFGGVTYAYGSSSGVLTMGGAITLSGAASYTGVLARGFCSDGSQVNVLTAGGAGTSLSFAGVTVACPSPLTVGRVVVTLNDPAAGNRSREPETYAPAAAPVAAGATAPTGEPMQHVDTSKCQPIAGGATTDVSATSASFTIDGSSLPPLAFPACAPGSTRVGASSVVKPVNAGSSVAPHTILATGTLGTATPAGHPEYGQCLPGGSAYPCVLVLRRILSDGTKRAYDPGVDYAAANDPAVRPRAFECAWGPLVVDVTECAPIYQTPPAPAPNPAGVPANNCDGSGFSFNPVSWVVTPLKCLFIPTPAMTTSIQAASADIRSRAPFSYIVELGGFAGTALGAGSATPTSSCLVFDAHLGTFIRNLHILNSCDDTEPVVHAFHQVPRTLLVLAELLAFAGPLAWWAWKSYAPLSSGNG